VKQAYNDTTFRGETLALINFINSLIASYQRQGFTLSVRQLYYQLVARDMVPNTERSYKRVASIINDGRLAGLIDWDAIEDRNRDIEVRGRWTSAAQIIRASAESFHMDMWDNQDTRVFVIVEKAALAGVLGGVCRRYDVPLLAARGYPSVSILREMVLEHFVDPMEAGQAIRVLHFGDHDPSGLDMTRDLDERIAMFIDGAGLSDGGGDFLIERLALNMPQIDEKKPPPNPAKVTDSRFEGYRERFGEESWELDALEPSYLVNLAESEIQQYIDDERWARRREEIDDIETRLKKTAVEYERK
jgi:hypothetical protein